MCVVLQRTHVEDWRKHAEEGKSIGEHVHLQIPLLRFNKYSGIIHIVWRICSSPQAWYTLLPLINDFRRSTWCYTFSSWRHSLRSNIITLKNVFWVLRKNLIKDGAKPMCYETHVIDSCWPIMAVLPTAEYKLLTLCTNLD